MQLKDGSATSLPESCWKTGLAVQPGFDPAQAPEAQFKHPKLGPAP